MKFRYLIILLLLLAGCDKFEGDQTVPSYLSIDSIDFYSVDDIQGTKNQNISDVWVYVDDNLIGGFEMPATIPVLVEGIHKLELRAGIILNGISDARAPNPCWKSVIINQFNFTPDSITNVSGSATYQDNAEFVWMENFEDASLAIKKSINSDTGIVRTQPANAPEAFVDEFSSFSGVSYLDKDRPYVQLVSDDGNGEGFAFDRGDFIFLELNYKNNIPLVVGVYIKLSDNTIEERPFIAVSPTDEWKKIYINFTPIVNETVDGQTYMIYIEAYIPDDDDNAVILLDNIKLVTRPNLK